jgi:NADH:ubiquinone oxidoreductase subunit
MKLFRALFIWWRDATLGTLVDTWLNGVPVGIDAFGNRYFRAKTGDRRWVVYRGSVDASRVPAEWHGWLHRTTDRPPGGHVAREPWQREHVPNLSGTEGAYHPAGSLTRGGVPAGGDYEPWRPA